jgi:hypothetical protein
MYVCVFVLYNIRIYVKRTGQCSVLFVFSLYLIVLGACITHRKLFTVIPVCNHSTLGFRIFCGRYYYLFF